MRFYTHQHHFYDGISIAADPDGSENSDGKTSRNM